MTLRPLVDSIANGRSLALTVVALSAAATCWVLALLLL